MRELSESKKVKLDTIFGRIRLVSLLTAIGFIVIAGIYFFIKVDKNFDKSSWIVIDEVSKLDNQKNGKLLESVSQSILIFKSKSFGLLAAIFFTFGSAIGLVLAEKNKHKPVTYYIIKAISLLLVVGYIVYVGLFDGMYLKVKGIPTYREYETVMLLLGYLGLAAVVVNTTTDLVHHTILGFEE